MTKKIIFLFPHFLLPGGAANVVLNLAQALQNKKYNVVILSAGIRKEIEKNYPHLNFETLKIPYSNSLRYWLFLPFWQKRINKKITSYGKCILFPHVLPSNWWAWFYKKKHPKQKIIWFAHEPSAFIHIKKWINSISGFTKRVGAKALNPFLRYVDINLEKQSDLVVCNSKYSAQEYKRIYKRKTNGIIYPPVTISIPEKLPTKEKIIFTVSRLSKFKNVDYLINSFTKITKEFPDYKLYIAGEGEEKENLQNLANKLKIEKQIKFLGKTSDKQLHELYAKAQYTVLCSKNEPFGLVPIESMIFGTPVIAHNSGGPQETILDNRTGFLFETKNDLTKKLDFALSINPKEYTTMQIQCKKRAKRYNISNAVYKLVSLIEKIDE